MLNKKILRDIWKNKSQFITIFLMVFLAVLVYVVTDGKILEHGTHDELLALKKNKNKIAICLHKNTSSIS